MAERVLRHVVLFSFKDEVGERSLQNIISSFKSLETAIDCVKSIEWGKDNSPEGLSKGLTHCFIVTFDGEVSRDLYLTHPKHLAFIELVKNQLKDVCVVDFWVN